MERKNLDLLDPIWDDSAHPHLNPLEITNHSHVPTNEFMPFDRQ